MNIFIELPTWLGDTIMATPAIEGLVAKHPNAKLTLFGSHVSTQALKEHPNVLKIVEDRSKNSKCRMIWLYKISKKLDKFDIAISFRSSFSSMLLLKFLKAKKRMQYKKNRFKMHQVEKYANFLKIKPKELKLYYKPFKYKKPTIGINPGATYGSAKRWNEEGFAKVIDHFSRDFDIILFGGPNEVDIANKIEKLSNSNLLNLAGKTSIQELVERVAGLSLFVTNDSGPMHIAAAYKVPTFALFGPTKQDETSPWYNPNAYIISKNLECMPCMKRVCPLKHHKCMQELSADEVVRKIEHHLSLGK